MNENQIVAIEVEDVETEETVTLESTIEALVEVAFHGTEVITAYKIATIINGTFKVMGVDKQIPTQMMYNYDRNGMIVRGQKAKKHFDRTEVTTFVTKYTQKHVK